MRTRHILAGAALLVCVGAGVAVASPAFSQAAEAAAPAAEVKVGLGIEKMEIKDASEAFKVAPDTKIYAWTKVAGCAETKITIAFYKGDAQVSKQELAVPRSPYRTNAYRTFRAADSGDWTVKVLAEDGKELGVATFKVEVAP
jgi:hypothetical protein